MVVGRWVKILFFLNLVTIRVWGQNFVLNPEFKYISNENDLKDTKIEVTDWFTGDLESIYPNYWGLGKEYQKGFAKGVLFNSKLYARTYLQTQLLQTLEKDVFYDIEIKILVSTNTNVDEIAKSKIWGIAFHQESIKKNIIKDIQPAFEITYFNKYNNLAKRRLRQTWAKEYGGIYDSSKDLWENKVLTIQFSYQAKGYEKWLIIGNFQDDNIYLENLAKKIKKYPKESFNINMSVYEVNIYPKRTTRF
jgi:hypothetical protein